MSAENPSTQKPPTSEAPDFVEVKQIKVPRTIYDASAGEVFFKNFLAGVGHGLGGVFVYLLFIGFMLYMAMRFIWPVFEPYVQMYQRSMDSLQKIQQMIPGGGDTTQGQNGAVNSNGQSITGWDIKLNGAQIKDLLPKDQQQGLPEEQQPQ